MAVDINTLYNPYHKIVTNDDGTREEIIEPATGKLYLDRTQHFDYKIEKGDLCYTLFTEKGFEWGGDWTSVWWCGYIFFFLAFRFRFRVDCNHLCADSVPKDQGFPQNRFT